MLFRSKYFLNKDPQKILFNKNLVTKNGRTFYEGNARLNKYLHLAQNVFIAKTNEKLFEDDLYAYVNGAVALNVQENYSILLKMSASPNIPKEISDFLDKIYIILLNAPLDELIEISHEDSEWKEKSLNRSKEKQRMNSLAYASEYQAQYADVIEIMEQMNI